MRRAAEQAKAHVPPTPRGPLTITIDGGTWVEPGHGGWDATTLVAERNGSPAPLWVRAIWRVTRIKLWAFEIRVLPADGQTLDELATALTAITGKAMERPAVDGDRAVFLYGSAGVNYWASHAMLDALDYVGRLIGDDVQHGPWAMRVRRADQPIPDQSDLSEG